MNKPQLIALLCFIGLTATAGVMKINQAPTLRTNAPGENTCAGCHSGNVNNGNATINFNLPTEYVPGQTYSLTFEIDDSTFPNGRLGFTTTALDGSNLKAGDFNALNTATTSLQVGTVQGNQRQYIGHKAAAGSVSSWTYEWTAPANAVGPIEFYTVGISANGNNSTSGDFAYQQTFTINPLIVPPTAGYQLTSPKCSDRLITFADTSLGTIDTYAWDFGPNATPATANTQGPHQVSFSQNGPHNIQLIVNGPNQSDTTNTLLELSTPPTQPAIDFANDSLVALGEAGTYQWFFVNTAGTLDSIPNANDSVLVYADFYDLGQNTGMVSVSVQNPAQCETFSDAFTLPFRTSIGNQLGESPISLYPNPAQDFLHIDYAFAGRAELQIRILSLEGKTLLSQSSAFDGQNTINVPTAGIASGLYLLEVRHGKQQQVFKWRKE
ncbi:MAG: choice-of-anchor V domain-containing protein [Bacteroidia bacterium]